MTIRNVVFAFLLKLLDIIETTIENKELKIMMILIFDSCVVSIMA